MQLEYFPEDRFPSGRAFFEYPFEEEYVRIHFENIMVVHNNWIRGHAAKRKRFERYHLWDVGDQVFPSCAR